MALLKLLMEMMEIRQRMEEAVSGQEEATLAELGVLPGGTFPVVLVPDAAAASDVVTARRAAAECRARASTGGDGEAGIDGAIIGRPQPGAIGMNFIDVESVDDYIAKIQANGGTLVRPKIHIPEVGYTAVCNDTEGNPVGLFQIDPTAG